MKKSTKPLRFILVGIANTAIDFIVLLSLTTFGLPLVVANFISTSVALTFSFFANRSFTFGSTGKKRSQAVRFLLVTLVGLWVLQPIVLVLAVPALEGMLSREASIVVAKLIATVVSMVWNYLLYDSLVFRKPQR
ncbi:GtrA family protein [Aurantimicrobium minutum]|uniref:GtrA family protein n=1 Tax=Aurantimicrobium minutum TaxID=708131 RepID=UPI002473EA57|nr:GtrA family protein [Aurantimicrobium minutum]MDH6239099.1 putative flippase GtrA [Aurantimicrobium minutum]